jgi:hypothetical protein
MNDTSSTYVAVRTVVGARRVCGCCLRSSQRAAFQDEMKLTRLTLPCGPAKTRIAGNAETSRSWAYHPCTRSYVSDCRFSSDLVSPNTGDLRTGQKGVTTTGRYLLKQSGHCWTNAFKADLCGLVQRHVSAAPGVIQQPDPTSRSSLSVEMFTNPLTDVNDAT